MLYKNTKQTQRTPFTLLTWGLLALSMILALAVIISQNRDTHAAPVTGFQPGNIMSDAVFTNKNSMSASQIQSFLNARTPYCDTNGTKPSEYGGGTRRQYAAAHGVSTPFRCFKNYTQNGKTAARIIYDAAQEFNINPQVLIVLIQKEQGLITDEWPWPVQYRSATGYGCPDTAACDSQYYGLTNQVRWAARMFRAIMNNSPTWYTPYKLGNNRVYWHPDLSRCGSSTVNIQNRTTVALYSYTPYRPNQAALNAGFGTGNSCSSYGNRNFYQYFKDWFGNPNGPIVKGAIGARHRELGGNTGLMGRPLGDEVPKADGGRYQVFQKGVIIWKSGLGAWDNRGAIRTEYRANGFESGRLGYPMSGETKMPDGGRYQQFENGRIYWKSGVGASVELD